MQEDLIIGIIQARRTNDIYKNIENVIRILDRSKRMLDQVDILFFSENWLSREPLEPNILFSAMERIGEYIPLFFAGANYVLEEDGIVSAGFLYNNGRIEKSCEKIFPSRAVGERGRLKRGKYYPPLEVKGWKIGCIACVDIFYPEISRLHTWNGADVIYNPASIPADRTILWHSMLHARASENTVFSIGVNGTGFVYPDGRITLGESIVFASNGEELARHGRHEGIISTVLDRRVTESIRRRWAFFDDLRMFSRIYSELLSKLSR